jgi:hypothetical protein
MPHASLLRTVVSASLHPAIPAALRCPAARPHLSTLPVLTIFPASTLQPCQAFALASPQLAADYRVHAVFSEDLFEVLGEEGRPDYR